MFSLVGHHNGRKIIRWGNVWLAFFLVTIGAALFAVGIYALVTRSWNSLVLLVGPAVGILTTAITLTVSFLTPAHRLPFLKLTDF
jgi:hypothetical protein